MVGHKLTNLSYYLTVSDYTIGIMPNTRVLKVDRNTKHSCWCVWLYGNTDLTLGTYLALYDDGRVERVTVAPDGEHILVVKGDKDG